MLEKGNSRRHSPLALFGFAMLLAALLTKHGVHSWNDASRLAQVDALVAHRSLAIDASPYAMTGDKYRYEGHYYSDKPPLLAVAAAVVAFPLERAGISLERTPGPAYYLLTLLTIGALFAAGLVALRGALLALGARPPWASAVALLCGTASLALPYATVFNNHTASGALAIGGMWQLLELRRGARRAAAAGFCLGAAAAVDITFFALLALVLLPLAAERSLRASLPWYLAGAAPPTVAYFALNVAVSGSVVPPSMNLALWTYPGSQFDAVHLSGIARHPNVSSTLAYAYELLLGAHGLFSYTPLTLFAVCGFVLLMRRAGPQRSLVAALGAATLFYVAAYVLMSTDASGWAYGCAWWAALMPTSFLLLAPLEGPLLRSRSLRLAFGVAAVVSVAVAWLGVPEPFPEGNGFVHNLVATLHGRHALLLGPALLCGLGGAALLVFRVLLAPERLASEPVAAAS